MQRRYTYYSLMEVAKMTEKEQPRFSCSTLSDYEEDKNKSVPRESFVQRVLDLCERAEKGTEGLPVSVLGFYGAPGVGKTWVLGLIRDGIRGVFEKRISLSYIDFEDVLCGKPSDSDEVGCSSAPVMCEDEKCLRKYEERFSKRLEDALGDGSNLHVVLLDDTEWLVFYPKFQEWLETVILPHVLSGKVLFILAGRYMLRWIDFSIRYRLQQVEVPGLTPQEVGELVRKYRRGGEALARKLYYNYTWGHTWTTAKILEKRAKSKEDIISVLEYIIGRMMVHIKRFISGEQQDGLPYELLEEGAVLRVFGAVAFKEFHQTVTGQARSTEDFQKAMRILQRATLVTWSNEWGGYIIDQPVRYVIFSWLRLRNPKKFVTLHSRARSLYERQMESYPMVFPSKVVGYLYHRAWESKARAQDVTVPLEDAIKEELLKKFDSMIDLALRDFGVQWNAVDLLNELEARLKHDEELEMVLSKDFIEQQLLVHVESFRKRFY